MSPDKDIFKMDTSPNQVKVIFTTNEQDLVLPESKQQLLVPAGTLLWIHPPYPTLNS